MLCIIFSDSFNFQMAEAISDEPRPVYSMNIQEAAETGQLEEVRYWYRKNRRSIFRGQDSVCSTPLYKAAFYGHIDIVKYLWKQSRIFIDIKEKRRRRLNQNCSNQFESLQKVKMNFPKNSESNVNDDLGFPLGAAAERGYLNIVEFLVNNGCHLEQREGWNKTALHLATIHNHKKIVKCLLEQGANVNCKDVHGKTPLFYATSDGFLPIMKLLIMAKADINIKSLFTKETALAWAIRDGSYEQIKILLDAGSDINNKSCEGKNVLFDAIRCSVEVVELLINREIDVNCIDDYSGQTALYDAIMLEKLDIVKLLIESGANVNHIDINNHSLFHYAAINNKIECAKMLLENGAVVQINNQNLDYSNPNEAIRNYLKSLPRNSENGSSVKPYTTKQNS